MPLIIFVTLILIGCLSYIGYRVWKGDEIEFTSCDFEEFHSMDNHPHGAFVPVGDEIILGSHNGKVTGPDELNEL